MPPPRSSTTCSQCRARKVKCEGGPGPCSNCTRLSFACSFAATSPVGAAAAGFSTSPASAPAPASSRPERRRGPRACVQCRSQKSRCSGDLPTCAACRARAKECVYPDLKRPSRRVHGSSNVNVGESVSVSPISPHVLQSSPSDAGSLPQPPTTAMASLAPVAASSSPNDSMSNSGFNLPPVRDQLHLVNDFFRHLHPSPVYSFLNEMPVTQRCLDGTLDETLLLALCAVSALHLGYAKYHPLATASWAQRAEDAVWAHVERPSVFGVQALLLVVRYRIETGSFQRAYMLFALAARAASALRLQYERIDLGHLAQEVRRRLMWCLMLLDTQFAIGLPESEMCSHESIYVKLPCREEEFHGDGDLESSSLDGVPEDGLLATYVRVAMMRRDVMRLMRQIRLAGGPTPQLVDLVDEFARSLQQLAVPPYTKHELDRYARSRWLVRYVVLHLSWHQAHCDAYRLFLLGYREAAPAVVISEYPASYIQMAAKLCLHHARAIIAILNDWAALGCFPVAAPHDISICGYHASRLVLFLSRWPALVSSESMNSESGVTPQDASSLANSVLAICKRLHGDSPLMNHLVRDLEAVIRAHAAGEPEHSSSDPDDDGAQTRDRQPRFAVTVQRHKSLGVHSILRRARFVDDSADEGLSKPADATDLAPPNPPSNSMAGALSMDTSAFDSLVRASSLAETQMQTQTQTPLETSLDMPLFPITGEPFDFASWDSWADLSWQTTFSPRSDADYL